MDTELRQTVNHERMNLIILALKPGAKGLISIRGLPVGFQQFDPRAEALDCFAFVCPFLIIVDDSTAQSPY